jgi:hypothetical protein
MTTDPMTPDIRGLPPVLGRDASHELMRSNNAARCSHVRHFFALGAYLGRDAPAGPVAVGRPQGSSDRKFSTSLANSS